jgi:hypothetical protein
MSADLRLLTALLLAHASSAAAEDRAPSFPDQQTQEQWKRAEELARMDELLQSLKLFKEGLPEYVTPYVNGTVTSLSRASHG